MDKQKPEPEVNDSCPHLYVIETKESPESGRDSGWFLHIDLIIYTFGKWIYIWILKHHIYV